MKHTLTAMAAMVLVLAAAAPARADERICTEKLVRMSDGARLHAWVSQAAPDRARPVLFMMDSYARGGKAGQGPTNDDACPQVLPDDYVPAYLSKDIVDRFNLVQVSYRGTGSSEGLFDMTAKRTQQDIHEAIAWAARQPFSAGGVTLVGESGTGFYEHHGLHEPHVKAAVIFTSCADMYRCFYRGGTYNGLADVYLPVTGLGWLAGRDGRGRNGTGSNPDGAQQLAAIASMSAQAKADGVDDAFWQDRSALGEVPKASVPVLYTTDLYDIVQPYDALQRTPNARFVLGMGHQSAATVTAGGARFTSLVRSAVDRFVAHYGLGEANGAERDPRVTLTTNTGSLDQFHAGRVLVRGEKAWPLPDTRWSRVYLGAGGTLGPAAGEGSDAAPLLSAPHADLRTAAWLGLAQTDLVNEERAGLSYTTAAFKRDLEVTGPLALRLFATATASDFDWAVRLTDVWPDGSSQWISDGYLRASLRKVDPSLSLRDGSGRIVRPWLTLDAPEPVPAGQPVEYLLDVIATSNVFRAGHRLRLDVLPVAEAGSDSARTGGVGTLSVLHDAAHPSSLTLPVIPGRCSRGAALVADTPKVSCAGSLAEAVGG
jgi:putative CocE/NonD family hydrolase